MSFFSLYYFVFDNQTKQIILKYLYIIQINTIKYEGVDRSEGKDGYYESYSKNKVCQRLEMITL